MEGCSGVFIDKQSKQFIYVPYYVTTWSFIYLIENIDGDGTQYTKCLIQIKSRFCVFVFSMFFDINLEHAAVK